MNTDRKSLLCLDRDRENLELLTYFFEREDFEVKTCTSFSDYSRQFRRKNFSAVIIENHFEDLTSEEVCNVIRATLPNIPIIFCSVEARQPEIAKAMKAGGNMYFVKPLEFDKVIFAVKNLIGLNQTSAFQKEIV